ncbi:hypothetical protein LGN04_28830 [Burkholderia multivorans]|uniref:hypothetical protein n=1 Tax=Burkholderia multivorans TaxID=87883 RepID=UPI001C230C48|nr:hypothetical protein [Burkholderia multivorans]MBU9434184.1 hypothetical protein [Burkholderia multivorans]MCA8457913.1 hypothetical protein [Burkholderia multivorans]MDN8015417.1 hypothetical protein [Burkholderia multivorans]
MSTNSTISILKNDGTVDLVYCHRDGYLIDGVGETLLNHYKDAESIRDLIKGGAIGDLGETKQATNFFGGNHSNDNCHSFKNIAEYHEANKEEFNYLFDENSSSWSFNKQYGRDTSFRPLTQDAINNDREQVVLSFIKERDNHPNDVKWRKDVIEEHIVKGANLENVKKMLRPYDLSKQISPYAQEKLDHAQTVADKINLKNKLFKETIQQLGQLSKPRTSNIKI